MKLSIVVPAFNEEMFIGQLLTKVCAVMEPTGISYEVVVVDDCSTDQTSMRVKEHSHPSIRLIQLSKNSGKGRAVQVGIQHARGDLVVVQDADLEYEPSDIPKLVAAQGSSRDVAVYGSRVLGARSHLSGLRRTTRLWPRQSFTSWVFNYVLTGVVFTLKRRLISDLLTGYKLYPKHVFDDWSPNTSGFETDHEITLRLINLGISVVEIPIMYFPRSKDEGKKIKAVDAWRAVKTVFEYRNV